MKILVLGSGGMLGHTTTVYLRSIGHKVIDISKSRSIDQRTLKIDITDKEFLDKKFLEQFDVVINCAALLNAVCDQYKSDAILLNSWIPHALEKTLADTTVKIIQVSTDGVFSGDKAPYSEYDCPDTQTFYGKTKLLGELNNEKDVTVRASFVGPDLSERGMGLFNWAVRQSGCIDGYSCVRFNGVTSLEFAKFVGQILDKPIAGICHLGASETISKANFLMRVKNCFNLNINIEDNSQVKSDHTLCVDRLAPWYTVHSYDDMLNELYLWMHKYRSLYPHYDFLQREAFV